MGKKITLLEQWDQINLMLEENAKEFIDNYFQGKERPQIIYSAPTYKGIVEEKVTKIDLYKQGRPYLHGKRPTRALVDELFQWATAYKPEVGDIYIHYVRMDSFGTVTGAHKISDIDNIRYSYSIDPLLSRLAELKEKFEPKEGHMACAYCMKQVPAETTVDYTIISRQYPGMRKTSKYCSKECGVHDQWAHEG